MFKLFKLKYFFLLLTLFLFSAHMHAQYEFEARVSKTKIYENERLRVEFIANFDGDYFRPPDFGSFNAHGPSTSISQSWINGKSSFNKGYSYIIEPTKTGRQTIGSAIIEYKGEKFKTKPIVIDVMSGEAPQQQGQNQNPYQQQQRQQNPIDVAEELQLIAEVNKSNPYVNEPVTVVYKMYLSYNIGIEDFKELNKPKYNDFWSHHFEIKQPMPKDVMRNGKKMRELELKKVVLYPQKNGSLEIEPLSYKLVLQVPTGRRDFFGRQEISTQEKVFSAGKRTLQVKALPLANQPENFSGAVGKFDFKVIPSRTALKAGESLDVQVQVSGPGNLKLFKLPEIKFPNAFEVYDPVNKQNISTALSGMTGSTIDTYTLIPQSKGNFTISDISFSYFDLGSNSYKTLQSEPFEIIVTDGDGNIAAAEDKDDDSSQSPVIRGEQFKYIHTNTELFSTNRGNFLGSIGHFGGMILILAFIPLFIFIKRRQDQRAGDVVGNRIKANQRLAKKYLKDAQLKLQEKALFYDALERSLHKYLKAKLQLETTEMTKERISELMTANNIAEQDIQQYIALLESCEFARYAPSTEAKMREDYELAVSTIAAIEKPLKS
jgi:hypothetical protein